jgi:Flp pilus assembly protein TadG
LKIDHSNEGPTGAFSRGAQGFRRLRGDERGQATTEFALILIPLLALVGGIIYFGIGLNYWLDMNRIANQGARWAAVNSWPSQCVRGETSCTQTYGTCDAQTGVLKNGSKATLQDVLYCNLRTSNNNPGQNCLPNKPCVRVCYPGKTPGLGGSAGPLRGDPVKVTLTQPYSFFFVNKVRITLTATATLRMEQKPTFITNAQGPTC